MQCEGDGILAMLLGGAIVAIADRPTRSTLLFGEPSREALLEYARWMRKTRDAVPPLSEVIHYDAVESLGALEHMKGRTAGKGSVNRVMQGQAEEGRVWLEDRYARLIEAADEPYWEGAFAEIADRTEADSDALDNVTASILAPLAEDFQSSHRAMLNQFIAHELMSAIEAYQLDHGSYPDDLDALAPDYLPDIPVDQFTGEDLIYEPAPDGTCCTRRAPMVWTMVGSWSATYRGGATPTPCTLPSGSPSRTPTDRAPQLAGTIVSKVGTLLRSTLSWFGPCPPADGELPLG
ncbi:MAG: hypothetical protein GF320_22100 [Armatimonadia bacterium]|nr:hypothetical protein [Armatimonadia bacterium]